MPGRTIYMLLIALSACAPAQQSRQPSMLPPAAQSVRSSALPASAADAPALNDAPASDASIGTAHPLIVEAASARKTWAVVCQARQDSDGDGRVAVTQRAHGKLGGDTLSSYLVLGSGPGETVDELAAYDPTGRWLVVRRVDRLELIDSVAGTRSELAGADARSDRAPYRAHRSVSFDAAGKRMLWVKGDAGRFRAVVRDLETGSEREIDPGSGELWRAELSADGNWALFHLIAEDTNKNGRLDWPLPPGESRWRCQGPVPAFDAWLSRGDSPVIAVASVVTGTARRVPGFAVTLGAGVVARDALGQLLLHRDAGTPLPPVQLATDKCGARVFATDAARELLLVACAGSAPAGRPELALVGPGMRQLLGVRVAPFTHDSAPGPARRLQPIYSGKDTLLFDFEARRLFRLTAGDLVVEVSGASALLRRGDRLLVFDALTGSEQLLPGQVDKLAEPVAATDASGVAAVAPLVVQLAARSVRGSFTGKPLAVASDASVLVAATDPTPERLAAGPLLWRAPLALSEPAALNDVSRSREARSTSP